MIFQIEDIPFLKKSLHLTLRNSENKASPLEIPQNCAICLGNSKAKNQDPWKFLTPEIFSCFLSKSLEIPCPQPAMSGFLQEQPNIRIIDKSEAEIQLSLKSSNKFFNKFLTDILLLFPNLNDLNSCGSLKLPLNGVTWTYFWEIYHCNHSTT